MEEEDEEEEEDNSMFLNNRRPYLPTPSCLGCPIWLRSNVIIMELVDAECFLKSQIMWISCKLYGLQITLATRVLLVL